LNPIGNRIDRKPQMPRRMLLLVAAGECLDMTLWFSATAAARVRARATFRAWLTMAVQAGFVEGTLIAAVVRRVRGGQLPVASCQLPARL
jgi:hypothetical protein